MFVSCPGEFGQDATVALYLARFFAYFAFGVIGEEQTEHFKRSLISFSRFNHPAILGTYSIGNCSPSMFGIT